MVKSPCKDICKVVKRKSDNERFCLGCGRTIEEIKKWTTYNDIEKTKVLERLKVK